MRHTGTEHDATAVVDPLHLAENQLFRALDFVEKILEDRQIECVLVRCAVGDKNQAGVA